MTDDTEAKPEGLAERWHRESKETDDESTWAAQGDCADDLINATESLAKKWEEEAAAERAVAKDPLSSGSGMYMRGSADTREELAAELRAVMVGKDV